MQVTEQALHRGAMVIVASAAAGLVWSTGFKGFMPLDQSIVWDGAWRVLQGQVPFVDFALPAGLTPIAIQAAIFKLAGVAWTSYVAHAALANAVFALAVYTTLVRLMGRIGPPFVYGLASGLALYPPMGTPYADLHAVLFLSLTLLLILRDCLLPRRSVLLWLAALACLLLALLAKPLPGLLAAPLFCLLLIAGPGTSRVAGMLTFLLSAATVAGLVGAEMLRIDPEVLVRSFWTLPGETGAARITPEFAGARLKDLFKPGLIAVLLALAYCGPVLARPGEARAWASHVAALGLALAAIAYVLLSDNSPWFGYGALPLAAGLVHYLLDRQGHRRAAWTVGAAVAIQAGVTHLDVSMTRAANELRHSGWIRAQDSAAVDPALAGLRWVLPKQVERDLKGEDRPADYRALLDLLKARDGNFVLIGDATILYALAGKPSAFPALWFHPGLAYEPGPEFDARIAEALRRHDVRRIVVDGERTWLGVKAEDFAPLKACLAGGAAEPVGRFRVIELHKDCIQR